MMANHGKPCYYTSANPFAICCACQEAVGFGPIFDCSASSLGDVDEFKFLSVLGRDRIL